MYHNCSRKPSHARPYQAFSVVSEMEKIWFGSFTFLEKLLPFYHNKFITIFLYFFEYLEDSLHGNKFQEE